MVERYDKTQNAMVEAETVERFDKPLNSWVDAESVQTYDNATMSWVERWKQWVTVQAFSENLNATYDTVEADKTRLTAYMSSVSEYIDRDKKCVYFYLATEENDVLTFDYDKSAEGIISCYTVVDGKTVFMILSGEATQGTYTYQCVSNGFYDFSKGVKFCLTRSINVVDATVTINNVEIGGKAVRFDY